MDPRTEDMLAERRRQAAASPPPTALERGLSAARTRVQGQRLRLIVASAATIVVLVWGYQVLIARPAELRAKAEFEARSVAMLKVETSVRSAALADCLTKVKTDADARWNLACRKRGQRAGCSLSGKLTDLLQQQEGHARNGCLLRFSIALSDD